MVLAESWAVLFVAECSMVQHGAATGFIQPACRDVRHDEAGLLMGPSPCRFCDGVLKEDCPQCNTQLHAVCLPTVSSHSIGRFVFRGVLSVSQVCFIMFPHFGP